MKKLDNPPRIPRLYPHQFQVKAPMLLELLRRKYERTAVRNAPHFADRYYK